MTAVFGAYPDWLSQTLAEADQDVPPLQQQLADGTRVRLLGLGALEMLPAQPLPTRLLLSAGVHGNETAPIEVLNGLVSDVLNGRLQLRLPTLFLLGNPAAMVAAKRELQHNLNRLFCGAWSQPPYAESAEGRRAAQLEAWVEGFVEPGNALLHYDLHTAIRGSKYERFAVYPFVPGRRLPTSQTRFLAASEIFTLLVQQGDATTFSAHTATRYGAQSFTVELGKVRAFGQNDLSRFQGIRDSLRGLLQNTALHLPAQTPPLQIYEVVHEIINSGDGFVLNIPEDVENFTEYLPGTVIWQDDQQQYVVTGQPQAIVFPNSKVGPGQRAGLLVCKAEQISVNTDGAVSGAH